MEVQSGILLFASLAAGAILTAQANDQPQRFIVQVPSQVLIHVDKAGAFGFAGHVHDVTAPVNGTISLDRRDLARSSVTLQFEAASLRVSGTGEPPADVPEVQRVMESDRVLDAQRFPTITFRSRRVVASRGGPAEFPAHVSVEGDLTLHGVTRPVTVPASLTLDGNVLKAEGTLTIRQSDFGIHPVTAAGGTVRVKDELQIRFTVQARES